MIWEKIRRDKKSGEVVVRSFMDIVNSFSSKERSLQQEVVWLFTLDSQRRVISRRVVAIGTERRALFSARVVLVQCLRDNACAFIVAHNHPSGEVSPSDEDKEMYESLKKAGNVVGIPCLDSIIIAETQCVSLCYGG